MLPQNWNIRRVINLIMGIFFVLIAVNDRAWFMLPVGLYFVAMAMFRFGCSSGDCTVDQRKNITK